jgi:DNA-binding beta-propeller fold protein YncE
MRKFTIVATTLIAALLGLTVLWAVEAPQWIGAFPIQNKAGLKWQPTEGADAYVVYRSTAGGAEEKLAEVSQPQYFDESVEAGESYDYTIKAVAGGVEGPASEVKSLTMPGIKKGEMTGPEWIGIREDRSRAMLRWNPMKGMDVVAYNVQRSETPGGPYEIISSTQENKYVDMDIIKGTTYYYVITALDANFQESPPSEELSYAHGSTEIPVEDLVMLADLVEIKMELEFELTRAGEKDLSAPSDVVVASNGDIFVTDVQNHRVVVYDAQGKFKSEFGQIGPTESVEPGAFNVVFTLAIDQQDRIYVTDIGSGDVQVFSIDGTFIRRFTTREIAGEKQFCPTGICVLPDGSMLLSDRDNDRFFKLDSNGKVLWNKGSKGSGEGQFVSPNEICVDSKGQIYVLDVLNQRVQVFDGEGNYQTHFGGVGNIVGTFGRPKGMFVDGQDRTWVADGLSNAIQVFGSDHKVQSSVGGGSDKNLWLANPRGMVVTDTRLYIVDRNNSRVLVFKLG